MPADTSVITNPQFAPVRPGQSLVSARLDPELHAEFKAYAESSGLTLSDAIREALTDAVKGDKTT